MSNIVGRNFPPRHNYDKVAETAQNPEELRQISYICVLPYYTPTHYARSSSCALVLRQALLCLLYAYT